ncbi:MAG: RHS repeat-associated core domain-containing protein, partial [Byssovorax sp.]
YEDPRFDVRGRGFLGFGTVREWDVARAAETTTTYDNATSDDNGQRLVYPGALKPKSVLRVVPMDGNGQAKRRNARLSRTETTYDLVRLNQGATYVVHPSTWGSLEWEEDVDVEYGDAARLHISGIDGVTEKEALRQRKGSSQYDTYGNVIDAQVETLHGVRSHAVSTYTNDTLNWLIGQLKTTDVTTTQPGQLEPVPRHKDYDYDARGLLCHVYTEKDHPSAEIPQLVTFTHDSEGLVMAVTTSAIGKPLRTVHVAYEPTERVYPTETWNDLGQASWSLYDPARGVALATENANGLQEHARYDDLGRLIQTVPEGGAKLDVSYEPRTTASGAVLGTRVHTVSATGSEARTDHDLLGRAVKHGHQGFGGGWIEEATVHDLLGRVVTRTRPDVNKPSKLATQVLYDNLDRPLLETFPGGGTITYQHTFSISTRSDTFTDRETVRDLDGRVIRTVDDARNTRPTTVFTYGAFNQLDHVTDPAGNAIMVHYDQRGRRTWVSDPDAGTTTVSYDGFGDEISRTVGGDKTTSDYDILGRLTQTDHAGELTITTWDTHGAGRLAHTLSPDGVEQDFIYNALGQLDTLTYSVDGEDFEFKMGYDGLGRVVNLAYPQVPGQSQRFSVGQAYTAWGYLGAVYDPTSFVYAPYWRVDSRNAEGQLTQATLGDGTIGLRTYEPETGLLASVSEGQALALSYEYYADGSLASRQDNLAGRDETFTYDAFHRLATWNLQKSPETSYHYDDLGNLTEIWSKPTPWSASTLQEKNTYGTNGKPHALTQGLRGAYTYDARGRQDTAPGRPLVTYNEHDLPRKITSSSGSDTLFTYDASGTRVKKQGPSETLLTLGGLYERRTVAGGIQHIFHVTGGDEGPVARIVSEQGDDLGKAKATYLHHDPRIGSVAAVTDAGGSLKEAFYYEPFGQRTDAHGKPLTSSPSEVRAGFTGHEHDDDLGLINMRGRMYDPVVRRFLSP